MPATRYAVQTERIKQIQRDGYAKLNDVSSRVPIKNPARRRRCKKNLAKWLKTYCPEVFYCGFGADHLRLIELTQEITMNEGSVVAVMPRGSGKTSIFQRAILWATLNGHSRFAVLVAADQDHFKRLQSGLKTILETNDLLFEDYPEVIACVRALEGKPIRALHQTWEGERTRIEWSADVIRFPTHSWTRKRGNAGATITGGGLTQAMRGLVQTTSDGEQIRPDLILIDDPQTRASAKSPTQVRTRLDILNGDLMHMKGAGRGLSALCACTVIYPDDLACKLVDADISPDWKPVKVPMLYSMPTNLELWYKYDAERRRELMGEVPEGSCTEFYQEHRAELDAGAHHYWPDRVEKGCVSAIQSAMNEYLKCSRTFAAECQGEPEATLQADLDPLVPTRLSKRMGVHERSAPPEDTVAITAHIDVNLHLLTWMIVAWNNEFRGSILDYASLPDQKRRHWTKHSLNYRLAQMFKGNDDRGRLRAAISTVCKQMLDVHYGDRTIDRIGVDVGYEPDAVEWAIRDTRQEGRVQAARGVGVGAKDSGLLRWAKSKGIVRGNHWAIHRKDPERLPWTWFDANYWKTEVYGALSVPREHSHAITFYHDRSVVHHQLAAEHFCAEVPILVEANGRKVNEWTLPAHKPDNEYWDNLVGCAALASVCGLRKPNERTDNGRRQKPVKRLKW